MGLFDQIMNYFIERYRSLHPDDPPTPGWEVVIAYDGENNPLPHFDETFKVQYTRNLPSKTHTQMHGDSHAVTVHIELSRALRELGEEAPRVHHIDINFVPANDTTMQIMYDPRTTQPIPEVGLDTDDWPTAELLPTVGIDSETKQALAEATDCVTITVEIHPSAGKHVLRGPIDGGPHE
jgi:hypothetical protein